MYLLIILSWSMAHRSIPIHLFTIPRPDTMPRGPRSHLEWAWQLEQLGGADGAGDVGGAATTPSTSTTTIISFETRILTAATATTSVMGIPTGNTIRSIVAALLIATKLRQTGLAVRPAEIRWPTGSLMLGARLAGREAIWAAI